jgi:hypothetical protein
MFHFAWRLKTRHSPIWDKGMEYDKRRWFERSYHLLLWLPALSQLLACSYALLLVCIQAPGSSIWELGTSVSVQDVVQG